MKISSELYENIVAITNKVKKTLAIGSSNKEEDRVKTSGFSLEAMVHIDNYTSYSKVFDPLTEKYKYKLQKDHEFSYSRIPAKRAQQYIINGIDNMVGNCDTMSSLFLYYLSSNPYFNKINASLIAIETPVYHLMVKLTLEDSSHVYVDPWANEVFDDNTKNESLFNIFRALINEEIAYIKNFNNKQVAKIKDIQASCLYEINKLENLKETMIDRHQNYISFLDKLYDSESDKSLIESQLEKVNSLKKKIIKKQDEIKFKRMLLDSSKDIINGKIFANLMDISKLQSIVGGDVIDITFKDFLDKFDKNECLLELEESKEQKQKFHQDINLLMFASRKKEYMDNMQVVDKDTHSKLLDEIESFRLKS